MFSTLLTGVVEQRFKRVQPGRARKQARRTAQFARLAIEVLEERLMLDGEDLLATPDANSEDPFIVAKAAELGNDPVRIFEFMRDQVGFESYAGSLRGSRGTLWSSAGNALDQSSLMIALLRASDVPARYAGGMLSDAAAQQLIASMFPDQLRVLGCLEPGALVSDPANDQSLLAEAKQHFWVEFDAGAGFVAADPSMPGAQIGDVFATATDGFVEVPEALRHKVRVRLERELTTPGFLFGPTQSLDTVLDETFSSVELVGRPLSIGHFVSTSALGSIFSVRTHTYSPYILFGDESDATTDLEVIRGRDYQEVFTNFPFGTQVLTGLFLTLDLTGPDVPDETLERAILDRIGFAARQNGGGGALNVDPNGPPALNGLDIVTISIVPGHHDPAAGQALSDEAAAAAEQAMGATPGDPQLAAGLNGSVAVTRLYALGFHAASDAVAGSLADVSLVREYFDRPRVTIVTQRVTPASATEAASYEIAIDLRRDFLRAIPYPGQSVRAETSFNFGYGVIEGELESELLHDLTTSDAPTFRSTSEVFEQATIEGIDVILISLENLASLDVLEISADAKARITDAVNRGLAVLVPRQSVTLDGKPAIAWYETDLETGETVAVTEDGSHGAIASGMLLYSLLAIVVAILIIGPGADGIGIATAQIVADNCFAPNSGSMQILECLKGVQRKLLARNDVSSYGKILGFFYIEALKIGTAFLANPKPTGVSAIVATRDNTAIAGITGIRETPPIPLGELLLGVPPLDDFLNLSGSNLAASIVPEPLLTLPVRGAELPTVFRIGIKNTMPTADTFELSFPTLPAGFQARSSLPRITIPAGGTAELGICLVPVGPIDPPNTNASFSVQVTSQTNPAVSVTETESFTIPEIHGVTIVADPVELTTTPGVAQQTAIVLQSVGNVSETVRLTAELPDGLSIEGLGDQSLAAGELRVLFVTLTPSPGTPLNSTLTARISADFGAAEAAEVTIPVEVVVPGAESISVAATESRRIGNVDLANRLDDLSIALTNLVQDCDSEIFKSQSLAALDAVIGLLGVDSILVTFVAPLTAARDQLAAAGTEQQCLDAVTNLGQTLDGFGDTVFAISEHNVEAFLLPNSQVAQPQTPTQFDLRIHNISASVVSTTYDITLGSLPPGVTGMLSQDSVTLFRDEFASVMVTITQNSPTELLAFEFTVTVAADGFPEVARTVRGTLTARNEFVSVVSVTATPPFTDAGGTVDVSARVLNVVNREQLAKASFIVRDPNGQQVGPASTPVDITLTVQASLVTVPLGTIDTTGFADGTYTVEVMLADMNDQPIPGGTGTGTFFVGSPVTASLDVSPNVLPPGTSTVTNTLEIQALAPLLNPPTVVGQAPVAGATDAIRSGDLVYVAGSGGISIFDVTDETNPTLIRTFGSIAKLIRIRGNQLIAVREATGANQPVSLSIYSLTDPQNPTLVGATPNIPYNFIHDVVVTDTHAYIVQLQLCYFLASGDIFEQNGDILAVNITNPASPFLERVLFNTNGTNNDGIGPAIGGCDPSGGDSFVWSAVQANSNTLLISGGTSTGTDVVTGVGRVQAVSIDPAAPDWMTIVGELQIPGTNQVLGIALDGNRALITADSGNFRDPNTDFFFTGDAIVGTLDVTNPRSPQLLHTEGFAGPTRLPGRPARVRSGLFAFGSHTGVGTEPILHLVDASDPRNLGMSQLDVAASAFERISADSDFIYSASAAGLTIYRVPRTDPFTLVGLQPVNGGSRGVAARNDIAYACGPNGIQVIDYSDPAAPAIQGTIVGNHSGCQVQDNVLLALRPVGNSSILDVYALQNTPLAPPLIGSSPVINYNLLNDLKSNSTHAFITQLNVCFFLGSNDIYHHAGDLISVALNLDSSANPTTAAPAIDSVLFNTNGDNTFDPTDVSGCAENGGDFNVWGVALANPRTAYLATTTVTGGNTQAGVGRVKVVDVTNPMNPAVVRELDIPGTVQTIGIGISGNVGVVIGSTQGFQDNPNGIVIGNLTVTTLDVTDPLDPKIVSSRTLDRITSTFWSNFVTLGNGLFAYSNLSFANNQNNPALLLIDASNPRSPLIGQIDVPLDFAQLNSLATDGEFLFTSDSAGISIYEINGLPGLPITARVQVPNGTGVAVVPGSFNISPTEIIPGADFDTLVFDLTLTSTGQIETITWDSTVSNMQPGESRAVTVDTTIDFGFQGTPGQVLLPPQSVVSEQVLSLNPASRTVQPGEPAIFTVTIANPAMLDVTYDLSVAGVPPEWVDFPMQVTIPSGGSVDLDLTLTSDPFAAEATFGFVVTASVGTVSGSVDGTLNLVGDPLLLDADPDSHGVVVSVSPVQADAGQGTAAAFVARITNTGTVPESFNLLASGLPAGIIANFETTSIEVPPGASNFRDVNFSVTPPLGTGPGMVPFTVTAASVVDATTMNTDGAILNVLAAGVDILITPGVFSPGTNFQLFVTNTGQFTDTFDLTLGGPAALAATLSVNSITLAAGAFQFVDASMAAIDFALPGDLQLTATATSRSSPAVQDTAAATVDIATAVGLDAAFDPGEVELPQPGATTFLLMVENTGNTEDVYTATITTTSGPVVASLIGLDGLPTQTIPTFRLPGLATGAILLNANLTAFGQGDVTVRITSQANAGVVASATATVMSELEVDPCDAVPVNRAFVDAGNVRAEVVNGRLTITGDKLLNDIRIAAGPVANSLCIIGNDGTTVNGSLAPELITGVTGSVFIRMSGRHDSLVFDGSVRPITLPGDLNIRMNSVGDTLRLDHVTVAGKTKIRTGRGRDLVELVDTVLAGKSTIFTGRGDDHITLARTQTLADIVLDGYLGNNSLDAGLLTRPNGRGNLFARAPRAQNHEVLLS